MSTPVIFKLEQGSKEDVVAFFPTIPGTYSPYTMTCYAHLGQHGSADSGYASSCKPAKPEQYADLLAELRRIGYDDLIIVKRFTQRHLAERRAALKAMEA